LKELGELCAFTRIEWSTELVLVFAGRADHLLQEVFSFGREVQGVGATVGGARSAFDELALFKLVDEHHDAAARESEMVCECLLGEPVGRADVAERASVVRLHAEGCQALLVEPAAFRAELGQEEGWAAGERRGG
jgi:hypothetical protein